MLLSFTRFAAHLRFALLTATLLFVLALNHQAVPTLRLQGGGKAARVGTSPRVAVVKKKVTFEGTNPLAIWLAPAAPAALPAPATLFRRLLELRATAAPRVRPGALPDLFRARLLGAALSPHAP